MSDVRTTITIYSETMTEDELMSLLGPEWFDTDDIYGLDFGEAPAPAEGRRWLYWQGDHGEGLDEEQKIAEILELRSDVTEVEVRQEDNNANYDDVVSAEVWKRDGRQAFATQLVPVTTSVMIATIRNARRQGNEHAAWLAVDSLLAGIERGAQL